MVIMNKFNRILLASGLAATASLMANSPAFADTKTGTVNLSGTVATSLAMNVVPLSNATSLAMTPGVNYSDVKIGNITGATTNSANGFKVTVNSTWRLVSGANSIPFTDFAEVPGTTSLAPSVRRSTLVANTPVDLNSINTSAPGNAQDVGFFISYNVPSNAAPGTYTGSITFTATDK